MRLATKGGTRVACRDRLVIPFSLTAISGHRVAAAPPAAGRERSDCISRRTSMYDEGLAERIRELLEEEPGMREKRMFGGLVFMLHGNMCVGIVKERLMVRVGPDDYGRLLGEQHAREMDITGRPLKGFILVDPEGFEADEDLTRWVGRGIAFARLLPEK
jgi:hypothetical protein